MNFLKNLFRKDQPSEPKASSGSQQVNELLLGLPVIREENISKYRQTIIRTESHPSMFVGSTNEVAGFVAKMSEETERHILSSQGIVRVEKRFLINASRVGEKILELQYQQFWENGMSSIYSEHVMRIGEDEFEVFGSELSAKRMKAVWQNNQKSPTSQMPQSNGSEVALGAAGLKQKYLQGERNFSHADLRSADLSWTNLSEINLEGADLRDANLKGATLVGANLSKANLQGANLYGATLRGADLSEANLYMVNLTGASMIAANLTGTTLPDGTKNM